MEQLLVFEGNIYIKYVLQHLKKSIYHRDTFKTQKYICNGALLEESPSILVVWVVSEYASSSFLILHHSFYMCYHNCKTEFQMIKIRLQALHLLPLTGFFYLDKNLTQYFLIFLFMSVISFKLQRKGAKLSPFNITPFNMTT